MPRKPQERETYEGPLLEGTALLPLTRGKVALLDAETAAWASQWAWLYHPGCPPFRTPRQSEGRKEKQIYLSREILRVSESNVEVKFKNKDKLDCRVMNLFTKTRSKRRVRTTKDGVAWSEPDGKWLVAWKLQQVLVDTLTEAIKLYRSREELGNG